MSKIIKAKRVVLWKDVPAERRITPKRFGRIRFGRCKAAVRVNAYWLRTGHRLVWRYRPCLFPPIPGADLCPFHGGPTVERTLTERWRKEIRRNQAVGRRGERQLRELLFDAWLETNLPWAVTAGKGGKDG